MPIIEEVCAITAKGQSTIPKSVRQALGVGYGGRIAFRVEGNQVTVRAVETEPDPALAPFLDLLARDLAENSAGITPLSPALAARMARLASGVVADPGAAIDGEVVL